MNNQLNDYQESIDQAIQSIEPKREALHKEAISKRDQLAHEISADAQRAALVAVIEKTLDQADAETIAAAPVIMGQFVAAQIKHPDALAGNGSIVLEVFTDAAKNLGEDNRRRSLEAVLLVTTGKISGGLYHYLAPWPARLSLDTLMQFCKIIDPAAYDIHADALAKLKADYATASRYADIFKAPVTITPTIIKSIQEDEPETVMVKNNNEGPPLKIAGVKLPGYGKTTRITRDDLAQVEQSPIWKSGVSVNALEVLQ